MKQGEGKRIGYLSAGPRVSTLPDADLTGARAHVVGMIRALENANWTVKRFVVGDRMRRAVSGQSPERVMGRGGLRILVVDLMRIGLGLYHALLAWHELRHEVDYVYERLATLQSLGWIFRRSGIPWILETNALLFHEASQDRNSLVLYRLARYMEIRSYRKCSLVVCVSEALRELVVRTAMIPPEKVVVIPNAVDAAIFDPARYSPHRLYPHFTIGFVGSLYRWAALDLLLHVVRSLRDEDLMIGVVIVGDGLMRVEWEALADRLALGDCVTFTGRIGWDRVPEQIAGFDICFSGQIPPEAGTNYLSPLKLYEYMAMAKPVIAANFEGTRIIVEDGVTGFLFESGDADTLAQAVRKAYDARASLMQMGVKARQEIITGHTWDVRARQLVDSLAKIRRN